MSQATVFVDLDHCLFDTDWFFWGEVRGFLNEWGITTDAIVETYFQIKTNGYTLAEHLELLVNSGAVDRGLVNAILRSFDRDFADLKKYLFEDSIDFLADIASNNNMTLVLLSFGQKSWQEMKTSRSGMENYFNRVIYTAKENSKGKAIRDFCEKGSRVFVIDNSPKELDYVKDEIPEAETFLLLPRMPKAFFGLESLVNSKLFLETRRYMTMKPALKHQRIFSLNEAAFEIKRITEGKNE